MYTKMNIMKEVKDKEVIKELQDLHRELEEEKERLCKKLDATGKIQLHYEIEGIDTAISRIERRIIERRGCL